MATLQFRDTNDKVYRTLKERAKRQHRSLSQEVIHILGDYLSRPTMDATGQSDLFLQLVGSWQGPETATQIMASIRKARVESGRFKASHVLFD